MSVLPASVRERIEQIRKFKTYYGVLKEMCLWLTGEGVTFVAMESTGIYTNPIYHTLLDFGDFDQVIKVNPAQVKALSGRKTDAADASWPCRLAECGLLGGSHIPPEQIAQARDLTRYRAKPVQARTSEIQRLQGTLEDACVKLDSVASDVLGKSSRAMIGALIDGERRGPVMAKPALGVLSKKAADLSMALEGRFSEQHALLCRLHLRHIDELTAPIEEIEARIEAMMAPQEARFDCLLLWACCTRIRVRRPLRAVVLRT